MILQAALIISSLAMRGPAAGQDLLPGGTTDAFARLFSLAGLNLALALLGVGWLTRRDPAAVLLRLGLRRPTRMDWLAGLVTAAALFVFANIATQIWAGAVPPEVFELQTAAARHIFNGLSDSLVLGLLFAVFAAASEELLYRGALQPVFGIALTSLFFTLIHTQYAFTPAAPDCFRAVAGFRRAARAFQRDSRYHRARELQWPALSAARAEPGIMNSTSAIIPTEAAWSISTP